MEALDSILVPIDFTECSLNALSVAITLSHRQQTQLHLLYVLNKDIARTDASDEQGTNLPSEHLIREGTDMIQMLATVTAQEQQINCTGSCRVGVIPAEIVAIASQVQASLIVMGTQSGADAEAFRLNSEAYQVIQEAVCPVLTVPGHQKWANFKRILFPVRPVPGALDKYEFARQLIQKNTAELTVLALSAPEEVISIRQLQEEIIVLNTKLAQDGVGSQTVFSQTDFMAETVLDKANELNADLLIITAGLVTTTANFFIGSFTQQIIHNAYLPVLSIRPDTDIAQRAGQVFWQYGRDDPGLSAIGL
ncbi:universal stress protein [Spirosoma migulaei]